MTRAPSDSMPRVQRGILLRSGSAMSRYAHPSSERARLARRKSCIATEPLPPWCVNTYSANPIVERYSLVPNWKTNHPPPLRTSGNLVMNSSCTTAQLCLPIANAKRSGDSEALAFANHLKCGPYFAIRSSTRIPAVLMSHVENKSECFCFYQVRE